jgi:excisionase family DNA binding protein
MGNEAKLLTIGEAAKRVGVSRDTLRRWEKKGKLKSQRSPTNRRYYNPEQLDVLIKGESKEVMKKTAQESKRKLSLSTRLFLAAILSSIAAVLIATSLVFLLGR